MEYLAWNISLIILVILNKQITWNISACKIKSSDIIEEIIKLQKQPDSSVWFVAEPSQLMIVVGHKGRLDMLCMVTTDPLKLINEKSIKDYRFIYDKLVW